jgi:membrane associated rhomboid family serine protease
MRQASVGYHCPECVREAHAASPHLRARSLLRGGPAYAAYALIGLNVVVWLVSSVLDRRVGASGFANEFTGEWGLYPPLVGVGEWWRLVTGGFLHAGALHLGMNMFVLYLVGSAIEPAIGRVRFVVSYLVALVGGALGVVLLFEPTQGLTVGASGAIFGMFGLLAVYQLTRGINPLHSGLGPIVLLNLIITFAVPNISIGGHLGGLFSGAIVGGILFAGRRLEQQPVVERVARLAMVVALGAAMFAFSLAEAHALLPGV